ncbi:hypothetical protein [Salinigranum sp. GCM10025319]|uniref:hypothetical protein n=1 Tax=Salinigranum sp. GCM10025319 TaxID=3252687 RepID=UPI003608DDF8
MTTGFDRRTERGSDDPTTVRSVAVTVDDVVTALEAHQRADTPAVLRVTPPFAGRMRARLHVVGETGAGGGEDPTDAETGAIHLPPERFVDPAVPTVPTVDETEDDLRREGTYSVERHREFHEAAVESWREAVRSGLVDRVTVGSGDETHTVEVKYLGGERA